MLGWILVEKFKHGKATSIGAGSGAIAGLVAVTPACASLDPVYAILLGLVAGAFKGVPAIAAIIGVSMAALVLVSRAFAGVIGKWPVEAG